MYYVKLVDLDEETVDPAVWGKNFPRQYDSYRRTVDTERTKYGGSEGDKHLEKDPRLKRIFAGYAFSIDYREAGMVRFPSTDCWWSINRTPLVRGWVSESMDGQPVAPHEPGGGRVLLGPAQRPISCST